MSIRLSFLRAQRGPGAEEVAQAGGDLLIARDCGQGLVGKQLGEGFESRVGVGQPQQHHFFESHCPVGDAVGLARQPFGGGLFLAVNIGCGKLLHKGQNGLIQFVFADAGVEPFQRPGHDLGIEALAVILDQGVTHLVDQAHGVECAGLDGLRRVLFRSPPLVHAEGEFPAGGEIGEDYIAAESKKCLVELITVACFTGNMKFHWYLPKHFLLGSFSVRCEISPRQVPKPLENRSRDAHKPRAGWEMKNTSSPSTVLKPSCSLAGL